MEETREKVLALYEGVIALLNEGMDINTMTVADMTKRAGIGKGTAYDYFSSKEEIIAKALVYYLRKKILFLQERLLERQSFCEKINAILDWMGENYGEDRCLSHGFKIGTDSFEIQKKIREECKNETPLRLLMLRTPLVADVIAAGRAEGYINPELSDYYAGAALFGQMMQYAMLMNLRDKEDREFIYSNVLKLLK